MIDFIDGYYYDKTKNIGDGYDKERAKKKAFSVLLPLIMQNELTERQNICLKYKYINNKSQTEIAEILKLSQPTVSRHIATAKEIVNNKLKYCYLALSKGLDEYEKLSNC
jgi:RNA polymerase sigma factor (sigma-70 family)